MTDIILMVFMLGLLATLTLCSLQKDDSNQMLSMSYTTAIKGLACIVVVLVHIPASFSNPIQDIVGSFGFVGVTAFFLISAYGFRVSIQRNSNYLAQFWKKRIPALLIPAMVINIIACCFGIVGFGTFNPSILLNINSYIYAILVAYFVFWIVYRTNKIPAWHKDALICMIIVLLSLLTYFTEVRPFFLWPTESVGCVWGLLLFYMKDRFLGAVNKKHILSVLVLSYLKFKTVFFLGDYLLRILLGAAVLAFAMALLAGKKFRDNSIIVKLGKISYEVYLCHLIVIDYAQHFLSASSSGVFVWFVVLVSVLIAWIANKASNVINKKMSKLYL